MRIPILIILTAFAVPVLCTTPSVANRSAANIGQAAPADPILDDATVNGWFDRSLTRGDGQVCPVRAGNDVTELVDGVAALKTMSDTMRAARGNLTVLKTFAGAPGDPLYPREFGSCVEGDDHNIYFTTSQGGANNRGCIARIGPDGKNFKILHSFNLMDGADPRGCMSKGADGSFMGTTYVGGNFGAGTIWRLSADGTQFGTVWHFRNGAPEPGVINPTEQQKMDWAGSYPVSPPVQATDGNWYGITSYSNNQQYGVIYSCGNGYHAIKWIKPVDVAELGMFGCAMVAGSDGNAYGTTIRGGLGWGTVFKLSGGGISTIHKFDFKNGAGAYSLIQGADKNLYGTASGGGSGLGGLVYRLSPTTGDFNVIHTFTASDGSTPTAGLVQAKDGSLYGVAEFQGPLGRGLIYKIGTNGENFRIIHAFNGSMAEGHYCVSAPIIHSNKKLYGLSNESVSPNGAGGVIYSLDVEKPDFIYALDWWMSDTFPLWAPNSPSLTTDFLEANNKGVQIRAMLWRNSTAEESLVQGGTVTKVPQNNNEVMHINTFSNGAAILDNKTLFAGSHHQKVLVVQGPDGLTGFCGGVDFNQDRLWPTATQKGSPMHDLHCKIRGPAAADLLNIFVERWKDHPGHQPLDDLKDPLSGDPVQVPDPIPGAFCSVQIGRTYGNGSAHPGADVTSFINSTGYTFAPNGEQSAAMIILHAISHAKSFIYVEDQYFVDTADPDNPNAINVRAALVNKLRDPNFQHLIILIPHGSITDMGPPLLPNQVNYRRNRLITALKQAGPGKVHVFFRGPIGGGHSYIHAKTWIFDDQFAVIGSANTNRRSWTHDSEVVAGICDKGNGTGFRMPHRLRMRLWAEHLNVGTLVGGVPTNYEAQLFDPQKGIDLWINHRPPTAYVVPYDETQSIELIHPDTAWNNAIDPDGR